MECLKTGCHAYLQEYDQYVYGDAFVDRSGGASFLVIRIVEASQARPVPGHPVLHIEVAYVAHWFDQGRESGDRPSTLISAGLWVWHGYDGVPNADAAALYNRTIPSDPE